MWSLSSRESAGTDSSGCFSEGLKDDKIDDENILTLYSAKFVF